jgi:hypothetical protein
MQGRQGTTTVAAEYSVVGYSRDGLESVATAVDQVLGGRMAPRELGGLPALL